MSFFKLSKEERAEWRGHPATKAFIEYLREKQHVSATSALIELRKGRTDSALSQSGNEEAYRLTADFMERE